MKTLSIKVKLFIVSICAVLCLACLGLGTISTAKAVPGGGGTTTLKGSVEITGSALYVADSEIAEKDANGYRLSIKINKTTFDQIAEGGKVGVYVCPTSLLPGGFNVSAPTETGAVIKEELATDGWKDNGDNTYSAFLTYFNFPSSMYKEGLTTVPYYDLNDGKGEKVGTSVEESMFGSVQKFIEQNHTSTNPDIQEILSALKETYTQQFTATFYDLGGNEVTSGTVCELEAPIMLLDDEYRQLGWFNEDYSVNARAWLTEDTNFYLYDENIYVSYDEEGADWYDTMGTKIFLGNDVAGKRALVTFDMYVESNCADFALGDITNGWKGIDTGLVSEDYGYDFVSYTALMTANENGEIILAVGDWHDEPQRVTGYFTNFSYEIANFAEVSYQSKDKYGIDIVFIPVEGAGDYDVTMKIKATPYQDDYVSNSIYYVTTVWSDNSIDAKTKVLDHADITGDWQEIRFTGTAVNFSSLKGTSACGAVTAPEGYYIAVINDRVKTDKVFPMTYKDIEVSKSATQSAFRSIKSNDKYCGDFIFIPVEGAGNYEVTMKIKTAQYEDQWFAASAGAVTEFWGDGSVKSKTGVLTNADITGDWQEITFTAPAVNQASVKYVANGSNFTCNAITAPSGYYVLFAIYNRSSSNAVAQYKDVEVEKEIFYVDRSTASNGYIGDAIYIEVPSAGTYEVTMDVKLSTWTDQYVNPALNVVKEQWGDVGTTKTSEQNLLKLGTGSGLTDGNITGDWQTITFTTNSTKFAKYCINDNVSPVANPFADSILLVYAQTKGAQTEVRNVKLTKLPTVGRSTKGNNCDGDIILLEVASAGTYNVTLDIKADAYQGNLQWWPGSIGVVKAVYGDSAINGTTTIKDYTTMVDEDWDTISFSATALTGAGVKNDRESNLIAAPSTYFIAVRVKVASSSAMTQVRNITVTPAV